MRGEDWLSMIAECHIEARYAAGHSNVSITSGYLHVAVEDDGVGSLFG
jgi:hypothetical protein